MRHVFWRWRLRGLAVLVVAVAAGLQCFGASAQSSSAARRAIDDGKNGIWFQIRASIQPVRDSSGAREDQDERTASLDVELRISAHAVGSNFYGKITRSFSNFRLAGGSKEAFYWQDVRCHQRRGLPKITVTAVNGSIKTDQGDVTVKARPRHIGLPLPDDEISAGRRLPDGIEKGWNFIAYRSQTLSSDLAINVRLYIVDCDLDDDAESASGSAPR